jgi:putative membrane protein
MWEYGEPAAAAPRQADSSRSQGAGKETPTDASGRPGPSGSAESGSAQSGSAQSGSAQTGSAQTGSAQSGPEGEPDARFTFANERTFLAWMRTALALVAAGLAIVQLLPPFPGVRWGRHAIGIPLIVLGSAVAVISYREWDANQRALRRGDPLRPTRLPSFLAATIALVALVAAVLALISG